MEATLFDVSVYAFAALGFFSSLLLLARWFLDELGEFIKFCRRWKADVFPTEGIRTQDPKA